MLQQTQVATVIDYYHRFLDRFPNVELLAAADEQVVLSYWSGLGYYRCARSLHAAAKLIVRQHGGAFPQAFEDVLDLPGVGRYTAGAITSMAYDARRPILEANTIRLYARLLGLREDPLTAASQAALWQFAEAILPKGKGSGKLNQAAMELGGLICTPLAPACASCPLQALCPTFRMGLQTQIPLAKTKPKITEEIHALAVVRQRNRVLMRRNREGDWWTGLWDFPRLRISPLSKAHQQHLLNLQAGMQQNLNSKVRERIASEFLSVLGLPCDLDGLLLKLTHGVTRYRIRLLCFEAAVPQNLAMEQLDGEWRWMRVSSKIELPLTSPASKILGKINVD